MSFVEYLCPLLLAPIASPSKRVISARAPARARPRAAATEADLRAPRDDRQVVLQARLGPLKAKQPSDRKEGGGGRRNRARALFFFARSFARGERSRAKRGGRGKRRAEKGRARGKRSGERKGAGGPRRARRGESRGRRKAWTPRRSTDPTFLLARLAMPIPCVCPLRPFASRRSRRAGIGLLPLPLLPPLPRLFVRVCASQVSRTRGRAGRRAVDVDGRGGGRRRWRGETEDAERGGGGDRTRRLPGLSLGVGGAAAIKKRGSGAESGGGVARGEERVLSERGQTSARGKGAGRTAGRRVQGGCMGSRAEPKEVMRAGADPEARSGVGRERTGGRGWVEAERRIGAVRGRGKKSKKEKHTRGKRRGGDG